MGMLIGKIQDVRFGFVGYQDCEYGLYLTLGSDKEHWGVGTCVSGGWSSEPTEHCKWTLEDQSERFAPDRNRTCWHGYQRDSAGLKRPFYGDRHSSNPPQNCKSGAKVAQNPTSRVLTRTTELED